MPRFGTPAEIDKSPQRKAPARLGRVAGYRNGRNGTQSNADAWDRNWQPAQHHADAWDRNHPESLRHTYRRASERRAFGRRASERKGSARRASERRAGPAPSRTSRRKPRQVSPTNHVPPTSDFRAGNRCALVFRDSPFIDRTTRRNSPSPARIHLVAADAFRY